MEHLCAELALDQITIDAHIQMRTALDDDVIDEYAEAMEAGAVFPPVVVFFDGDTHWLSDGFHRYHAAGRAGRTILLAEQRDGTRRDALLYACSANASHGLRRTNADKRKAVTTLLADEEWVIWSNRESPGTVGSVNTWFAHCAQVAVRNLAISPSMAPRRSWTPRTSGKLPATVSLLGRRQTLSRPLAS